MRFFKMTRVLYYLSAPHLLHNRKIPEFTIDFTASCRSVGGEGKQVVFPETIFIFLCHSELSVHDSRTCMALDLNSTQTQVSLP